MGTLRLHSSTWINENTLVESLVNEAINIYGVDFLYIPRKFVAKDEILGEDRLSKFENAYPIVMYMEEAEGGFAGQGAFASKFGLIVEQQATLSVSRLNWMEAVGRYGETILPKRPAEGDLVYLPMTGGLFEILFVEHQKPFYQLGQLYVYRLTVEQFRYSSEVLDTSVPDIDVFNSLSTETGKDVQSPKSYGDNTRFQEQANGVIFDPKNPFGD